MGQKILPWLGMLRVSKNFRAGIRAGTSGIFRVLRVLRVFGRVTRKLPEPNTRKIPEIPAKIPEIPEKIPEINPKSHFQVNFWYFFAGISGIFRVFSSGGYFCQVFRVFFSGISGIFRVFGSGIFRVYPS